MNYSDQEAWRATSDRRAIEALKAALAAKDAELAKANLAVEGFKRVYETQTAAIEEWAAKVKARDAAIRECVEAMEEAAMFSDNLPKVQDLLNATIAKHKEPAP